LAGGGRHKRRYLARSGVAARGAASCIALNGRGVMAVRGVIRRAIELTGVAQRNGLA